MEIILCGGETELARAAADVIKSQLDKKPDSVIGFATGSTPLGMYKRLAELYKNGEIDFSRAVSFNLDEYYPIKSSDSRSYHKFMYDNLFRHININPSNIHIPDGETDDPERECAEYERKIEAAGEIDIQILGLGRNGHIGFNEPAPELYAKTHLTELSHDTIEANSRFFENESCVPRHALTMGMASILRAKRILLLASGAEKREAIASLLSPYVTTQSPVTMLKLRRGVTLVCDNKAYPGEYKNDGGDKRL